MKPKQQYMSYAKSTFLRYLENNFADAFYAVAKQYGLDNIELFERSIPSSFKVDEVEDELDSVELCRVAITDFDNWIIKFLVVVKATYNLSIETSGHTLESCQRSLWITIPCSGKIGSNRLGDFKIESPYEYHKGTVASLGISEYLVPILSKRSFEEAGNLILNEIDPAILEGEGAIDPIALAEKLGFQVIERRITTDEKILSQFYFEQTESVFYSDEIDYLKPYNEVVPANTIVVDPVANHHKSCFSINISIAHEIVHALLHRVAYFFVKMCNANINKISCDKNGQIEGVEDKKLSTFLEQQANGIAPYLLMPTKRFHKSLKKLIDKTNALKAYDPLRTPEYFIDQIAKEFGVTLYAAKKRLLQVGFEEAAGAYNWVGKYKIPSFSFKRGSLSDGESFIIRNKDLSAIVSNNPKIYKTLSKAEYVFVEHHLCLCSPKFVTKDRDGYLRLTEYARLHLDECCLKIKVTPKRPQEIRDPFDSIGYVCRTPGPSPEYLAGTLTNADENVDPEAQKEAFLERAKEIKALRKICSMDFVAAIEIIRQYKDISAATIAKRSGLSVRTVNRYMAGERPKNLAHFVAFAHAFEIYPDTVNDLMKLAGIIFPQNDIASLAFIDIFTVMRKSTLVEVNAYLNNLGLPTIPE